MQHSDVAANWPESPDETRVHASCVALDAAHGCLILGPSGSGKSGLALAMMALGAGLVADDQVLLRPTGERLLALCPPRLEGLIEARGIGILRAAPLGGCAVRLVVDLGVAEASRLPPERSVTMLGVALPLVHRVESPHFAAALMQYLRAGRAA